MEHNVTKGKTYLVTAKDETTVTDVESGYILRVVPANSQAVIVAISNMIETSGECKLDPFANAHLLALGAGTGGGSASGDNSGSETTYQHALIQGYTIATIAGLTYHLAAPLNSIFPVIDIHTEIVGCQLMCNTLYDHTNGNITALLVTGSGDFPLSDNIETVTGLVDVVESMTDATGGVHLKVTCF